MNPQASARQSERRENWGTPRPIFDPLNRKYRFTLDAAASRDNHKCALYFTEEDDGLSQDWGKHRVWLNPPYGEPEAPCGPKCKTKRCATRGFHNAGRVPGIIDWIRKAYTSAQAGALVVCLVPASTDTAWWHDYAMKGEITFYRGRITFEGAPAPAMFPSALVVFHPYIL